MVSRWGFIHRLQRSKQKVELFPFSEIAIWAIKLNTVMFDVLTSVLFDMHSDRIESLLQEAEQCLQKSEICENQRDFVSALSYCTEAASKCYRGFELATELDW